MRKLNMVVVHYFPSFGVFSYCSHFPEECRDRNGDGNYNLYAYVKWETF